MRVNPRMCLPVVAAMFLGASLGSAQTIRVFDPMDARASFQSMGEYLSAAGGRWKAPNPDFNPDTPRGPSHFGLWFDWHPRLQLLELRIVVHRGDSAMVSSQGHWVWDPGTDSLRYAMAASGGRYTEGATTFDARDTFVTVATTYGTGEQEVRHRDVNVLVSGDVHLNLSFRETAEGAWADQGTYEWRRVR